MPNSRKSVAGSTIVVVAAGQFRRLASTIGRRTSGPGMFRFFMWAVVTISSLSPLVGVANGENSGTGDDSFSIEFVQVGDASNAADLTGAPSPIRLVP